MNKNMLYRSIPKVDILLENEAVQELIEHYSRDTVMESIHIEMDKLRKFIGQCEDEEKAKAQIELLVPHIEMTVAKMHTPNMRMVVNGTGTVLHTNLGRAPIGKKHMDRLYALATGYSNLEYNLEAGKRGERYSHFEKLLCKITGAEAAMAVNNNAAAVMLILSSLAKGGEVVVSRGELVEIGGKFRIPDVMEQSGATLVEVGTTNKTHYDDYENAITEETKALLKVHTSNYRIVGFTDTVGIDELIPIAKEHDIHTFSEHGVSVAIAKLEDLQRSVDKALTVHNAEEGRATDGFMSMLQMQRIWRGYADSWQRTAQHPGTALFLQIQRNRRNGALMNLKSIRKWTHRVLIC